LDGGELNGPLADSRPGRPLHGCGRIDPGTALFPFMIMRPDSARASPPSGLRICLKRAGGIPTVAFARNGRSWPQDPRALSTP